jgi:cell division septation protein DedD
VYLLLFACAAAAVILVSRPAAADAPEPVMLAVVIGTQSGTEGNTNQQQPAESATATEPLPPSNTLISEPPPKTQSQQATQPQPIPSPAPETPAAATSTQQIPQQAATQTVQPAPAGNEPYQLPAQYSVTSGPMLTESDAKSRADSLRAAGYHPFIKQRKTPSGDTYFTLELGRFNDMDLALGLLMKIKLIDPDYYITGASAAGGGGTISGRLADVLPTRKDGDEQLQLLETQVKNQNQHAAGGGKARSQTQDGVERLIVRKIIRPQDKGTAAAGVGAKPKTPVGGGATSSAATVVGFTQPVTPSVRSLSVQQKIRNTAWNMREDGFDVYYEREAEPSPEGVLVGIFDSEKDALSLADELKGYGYSVSVIQEDSGGLYQVLADPESVAGDISVITEDKIGKFRQSTEFKPPADPTANALLGLMKSQPHSATH